MALPTDEDRKAVREADKQMQQERNAAAWARHPEWEDHDPKAIAAMYKKGADGEGGEAAPKRKRGRR